MKFITFILLLLCITVTLSAQVPNSGFENWTDEITPQDWNTNNFPSFWTTVSRSSNSYAGSYAVKMEIANYNGSPRFPVLNSTFSINQYYEELNGYYRFQPDGDEIVLSVYTYVFKDGLLAGVGGVDIENAVSSYTMFSFDPAPGYSGTADSITVQFEMVSDDIGANLGIGSYALIDQLSFGGTSDVKQINQNPSAYLLRQNYPNPFNPTTTIEFSIPQESFVELKVFDILGNEVATLVNNNYSAGDYKTDFEGDDLPSGIYVTRLTAGNFTQTIKMVLLK